MKKTLLFGTDGIRNKVGVYPFTQEALPALGRALALWAEEKYGEKATFLLARDTRYSGPWIKAHLTSGLLSIPLKVYDAGILPTPVLFHLIKDNPRYTCGIIISASHNPAQDNGIKLIDAGGKLSAEDEKRIIELMTNQTPALDYTALGNLLTYTTAQDHYYEKILSLFPPQFLKGHKIVLDCAQGATYRLAPLLFKALGAHTIVINNKPNGYNINEQCGATHLEALQQEVLKQKASVGFAFDGDGDRVIAVNGAGHIKDGDDILAMLMEHPSYRHQPAMISTVMANQGFEMHMNSLGKELVRTPVGDKYIVEALTHHGLSLGGEPSGHIVLNDIISTGDGILVALKLLEAMICTGNNELVSFTKFPQVLINVPIKIQKALHEPPLSDVIAASKERLRRGRLLVRYSGTEPLVRVMVEDVDSELTKAVAQTLATQLSAVLS